MRTASVEIKHSNIVSNTGADPGLTVGGGLSIPRESLCATPTFDVISAHDMLYEEKVNK